MLCVLKFHSQKPCFHVCKNSGRKKKEFRFMDKFLKREESVLSVGQREKYWRSAGFRRTKRSRIHKRSECFFNETKLQKNVELKSISGLKLQLFQLAFNPAFCQYHVSRSVFFSASNPQASHFSLAKFLYKYLLKLVFLYPSKYQIVVQLKHFSLC